MLSPRAARLAGLATLAFVVMVSYGLVRPPVESLFLAEYTSRALPWAWLAVAASMAGVVALYSRRVVRTDLATLFGQVVAVTLTLLALLLAARRGHVPGATFLLYVWKDVYVVVLVEVFWSFANSVFDLRTARWAYGLFGVMSSLGGAVAGVLTGRLAPLLGSAQLPFAVFPVLGVAWALTRWLARHADPLSVAPKAALPSFADGFALLKKSAYLPYIFALISLVQVVITLVDYQFNYLAERQFPLVDQRAGALGNVYAAIDAGAMILHVLTPPVLRALGVTGTLFSIPAVLGAGLVSFLVAPRFAVIAAVKVLAKAFDYSLFRNAKELLYLPLDYDEKTRGKAFADMLSYRVAKGGASLVLLGLAAVAAPPFAAAALALSLIAGWLGVTAAIARRYRALTDPPAKMSAPPAL